MDFKLKQAHDAIDALHKQALAEIAKAQQAASVVDGIPEEKGFKTFTPWPLWTGNLQWYDAVEVRKHRSPDEAMAAVDAVMAQCAALRPVNEAAAAHNDALIAAAAAFCRLLKLPESRRISEYETVRGKSKLTTREVGKWADAFAALKPPAPSWDDVTRWHQRKLEEITRWRRELDDLARAQQEAKERAETARRERERIAELERLARQAQQNPPPAQAPRPPVPSRVEKDMPDATPAGDRFAVLDVGDTEPERSEA